MIIDTHIHLPDVTEKRTFTESKELLLNDLKNDQVDYAILIPDNIPDSVIGDVPTILRLFQYRSEIFILGIINVETQGDKWIRHLESMIDQHKIIGVKIFPGHDPIYPTDTRLKPVYNLCQKTGVPIVIHTGWNSGHPEAAKYNDPKYIIRVAERYPDIEILIAHLFWPEVEYCFEMTHAFSNIYYDTSALADSEVVMETGFERIESVLMEIIQEDHNKLIFGTDYAMCNRRDHIEMINNLPITEKEREAIFYRNAIKLFNLPISNG